MLNLKEQQILFNDDGIISESIKSKKFWIRESESGFESKKFQDRPLIGPKPRIWGVFWSAMPSSPAHDDFVQAPPKDETLESLGIAK